MRIFPAKTFESILPPRGLILIELMVVIALIGLLLLIAAPNFQAMLKTPLEVETGRLAGLIRALRNEAVLSGDKFRLMVDLRKGAYFVEKKNQEGDFSQAELEYLRRHTLPESIELVALEVMGEIIRPERNIKPVPIFIDNSGSIDPFTLYFKNQKKDYAFQVRGFTGKVDLLSDETPR